MGSDIAMEKVITHTWGEWGMDGDFQLFSIYRRSSYDNKEIRIWYGTAEQVEQSRTLIELLIGKHIPERPEPVFTKRTRIFQVLDEFSGLIDPDTSVVRDYTDKIMEIVNGD